VTAVSPAAGGPADAGAADASAEPSAGERLAAVWFGDRPPTPRRKRKRALAQQLREVIAAATQLDAEAADDPALAAVEEAAAALHAALAAAPRLQARSAASSDGEDAHLFERSPFTGRCNPLAAPLVLDFDGAVTTGHATYSEAYEGPPGTVHGGHVIAAFDDLLGVAQVASGTAGLTGTLTVRLLAPTPLHTRIAYEAGVERREGRKVIAWGRSTVDGRPLAEATGIFIAPRGVSGDPQEALRD
jgi:acyl-coenzyme A thioesterase PaaI-like protein